MQEEDIHINYYGMVSTGVGEIRRKGDGRCHIIAKWLECRRPAQD